MRFAAISRQLRRCKLPRALLMSAKPALRRTGLGSQVMPLLVVSPPSAPVRGDKRRLVLAGLVIALVLAAVAAWSAIRPGGYGRPSPGCVTVTIPSSTGGAMLHECGPRARVMCRRAFVHEDRLSLLVRPPCRAASLRIVARGVRRRLRHERSEVVCGTFWPTDRFVGRS